jgi:hypothetical protein
MSSSQQRKSACSSCHEKRILCDRQLPSCNSCTKTALNCTYPATNSRYAARRFQSCQECRRRRIKCDKKRPCGSCVITEVGCVYGAVRTIDSQSSISPIPRITVTDPVPVPGENAYSTPIRSATDEVRLPVYPSLLLGNDLEPTNLTELHPSIAQIWLLWHVFVENVDPLFKLFHAPSLQKQLLLAAQDMDSIEADLETLLFAVYFAATVVQDDAECISKYKQPKMDLLKRWAVNLTCRRSRMIADREIDTVMPLSGLSLAPNLWVLYQ